GEGGNSNSDHPRGKKFGLEPGQNGEHPWGVPAGRHRCCPGNERGLHRSEPIVHGPFQLQGQGVRQQGIFYEPAGRGLHGLSRRTGGQHPLSARRGTGSGPTGIQFPERDKMNPMDRSRITLFFLLMALGTSAQLERPNASPYTLEGTYEKLVKQYPMVRRISEHGFKGITKSEELIYHK